MKPSDELIKKFQRIYLEEFGEEISEKDAYEKFLRLVNLLRVILRPAPGNDQSKENPGPGPFGFDQTDRNGKLENHN